jgi:hypothetical protein
MKAFRVALAAVVVVSMSLALGCGGSSGPGNPPPLAPQITTQPQDQSTPLTQTATFKVQASGTAPLSFQWSKDGTPIQGGVSDSYTTPPVAAGDSGSTYSVTVTNAVSSLTSRQATLTVGPRSPKAGDLRFQLVASAYTVNGYGNAGPGFHINLLGRLGLFFGNYYGSPLSMGGNCFGSANPVNCVYFLDALPLPVNVPDLKSNYQADMLELFDSNMSSSVIAPNKVVSSILLEPLNDDYAVSWIEDPAGSGFDYAQQTVALSNLQTYATQQGALGRVITGASFDAAGDVFVMSYGWQGDPNTVYETQVATATFDTVGAVATNLAAQGYIITALGAGNDSAQGIASNGLMLIGTRVQGDSLARPLKAVPNGDQKTELWDQGYAIVGYVINPNGFDATWIGER